MFTDWYQDYPHPLDWFDVLLNGNRITQTHNNNPGNVDVPSVNNEIDALKKNSDITPEVNARWAQVDKDLMVTYATTVPYMNRSQTDFFSTKMDMSCYVVPRAVTSSGLRPELHEVGDVCGRRAPAIGRPLLVRPWAAEGKKASGNRVHVRFHARHRRGAREPRAWRDRGQEPVASGLAPAPPELRRARLPRALRRIVVACALAPALRAARRAAPVRTKTTSGRRSRGTVSRFRSSRRAVHAERGVRRRQAFPVGAAALACRWQVRVRRRQRRAATWPCASSTAARTRSRSGSAPRSSA